MLPRHENFCRRQLRFKKLSSDLCELEASDGRPQLLHPEGGRSQAVGHQDLVVADVGNVKAETRFLGSML
jgi:hypothetical protein